MTSHIRPRATTLLRALGLAAVLAPSACLQGADDAVDKDSQLFQELRAPDAEEAAFLQQINTYRAGLGLTPLVSTRLLNQVAYDHSLDMATRSYFDHSSPEGLSPFDRMRNAGYAGGSMAENIAAGNSTAAATFEQWRTSPGHDTNMRGTRYRAIGIGRAWVAGSPYRYYWTTDFGDVVDGTAITPTADAGAPAPADAGPRADAGAPTDAGATGYPTAVAVSANESAATARRIPEGAAFVASGSTTGMANDKRPTCASSSAPDAAFRLDLSAARSVRLDTVGSSFDTVLHVYRSDGALVGCNDDADNTRLSRLSLTLAAGTYYVWVDGYSTARGAYQLRYSPTP